MSGPHILVDADACPVVRQVESIAQSYGLPVTLLCDEHHVMQSAYSQVRHVSSGADAVDIALMNLCRRGDVVITQDYGVAAMALGRGAFCMHHSGKRYTDGNIDLLLAERHAAKKARMASRKHHLRGPSRFTDEDRRHFAQAFETLLLEALHTSSDKQEGNP